MNEKTPGSGKSPGFLCRMWRVLRRPSAKWSALTLLLVGVVAGIVFWNGFETALDKTDQLEFCISCHEMRDGPYPEYKKTIHYQNKYGVRAACPDCHVPHALMPLLWRKVQASQEVWGKLTGKIDTHEKFETNRMELATKEWARMKANGSAECQRCHNWDAMDKDAQGQTRYNKHMQARASGQTCIDCHKGIAHHLPKEYHDPDEDE
ncbi:NapC/NirT family cytochrome c [Paraburkholderia denitrificans]|uniref:Cytochrome c-type protein n=1 Tax=Paraburkholderia denitrificans TaxID=694025 RepID=A0ABW0JDY3_9BURK